MILNRFFKKSNEERNYFTVFLLLFIVFSAFSPRLKWIYHAFFIFIAFPWLFWAIKNYRETLHFSHEGFAWILFLGWIAFQECFLAVVTDDRYIKYACYIAIFVMFPARLVSMRIFRSENVLRGAFWALVAFSIFSLSVDWLSGVWYPGGRLFFLQPDTSPYFHPYLLVMLLSLLLPHWISTKRWGEILYSLGALFFVNGFCFASRSALLGTAVVLLANFVIHMRRHPRLAVGYAGILIFLVALVLVAFQEFPFLYRMIERADSERFELWHMHIQNLMQYNGLFFGLGQRYINILQPGNSLGRPHNLYIALLVFHGIWALLFWLILCALTLHKAWRNHDPWGVALLAGLAEAAFMSENIVGITNAFWILILLPMGLILNPDLQSGQQSKQGAAHDP